MMAPGMLTQALQGHQKAHLHVERYQDQERDSRREAPGLSVINFQG